MGLDPRSHTTALVKAVMFNTYSDHYVARKVGLFLGSDRLRYVCPTVVHPQQVVQEGGSPPATAGGAREGGSPPKKK